MKPCINCGTQLDEYASYCHFCGTETEVQQSQRRCLNCGADVAAAATTCIHCRQPIDHLPATALPTQKMIPIAALTLLILVSVAWLGRPSASEAVITLASPLTPTVTPVRYTRTPTPSPTITPIPTPTPTFTPTPSPTPTPIIHTIRRGETLSFIAETYGVSINDIIRASRITEDTLLQVGAELIIPAANTIPGAVVSDGRTVLEYTIQEGDTLFGLALRYDVSLATLSLANPNIDLDLLSIGQQILIPLGGPILTVTPTPRPPTPTFTPGPTYLKPELVWPLNGAVVEGDGVTAHLSWLSRQVLADDVYYVVTVTDEAGNQSVFWTQNPDYSLPLEMKPANLQEFHWFVVIMEQTGDGEEVFQGEALSQPSEVRRFLWR